MLNSSGAFFTSTLKDTHSPASGFNSSHGHLVNYPSTSVRHQWALYTPEQREDLNEIINIRGMAPTCAPGHSDPSQDLPSQAGRASEILAVRGCRGGGKLAVQVTQEMPGKGWGPSDCFSEARRLSTGQQKTGALAELG